MSLTLRVLLFVMIVGGAVQVTLWWDRWNNR